MEQAHSEHDMAMLLVSLHKRLDECEGVLIHIHRDELLMLLRAAGMTPCCPPGEPHSFDCPAGVTVVGAPGVPPEVVELAKRHLGVTASNQTRDDLSPLLYCYGELQWRSGRGHDVSHEQIAAAFEAVLTAARGAIASDPA